MAAPHSSLRLSPIFLLLLAAAARGFSLIIIITCTVYLRFLNHLRPRFAKIANQTARERETAVVTDVSYCMYPPLSLSGERLCLLYNFGPPTANQVSFLFLVWDVLNVSATVKGKKKSKHAFSSSTAPASSRETDAIEDALGKIRRTAGQDDEENVRRSGKLLRC